MLTYIFYHYITEFVSGGPKNYAYLLNNGETNFKVKGVTVNYRNSEVVNFDSVRDFILDNIMGSEMLGTMFTDKYIYIQNKCNLKRTPMIKVLQLNTSIKNMLSVMINVILLLMIIILIL